MKILKKAFLLVFLGMLATANSASAGAWTQEKGDSYNRLAVNYYYSDRFYIDGGDRIDYAYNGEFEEFNVNYYAEYGLTDVLTLIGSFYYKDIEKEDDYWKLNTRGVGDIDLAVKYRLFQGRLGVFSVQGLVKIPEAYDENQRLPLGNGQYDYELRLLYGRSLWPLVPGYCNFETAYRWRTEAPSDEFRILAEIGSDFGTHFYGRIKLDGIFSTESQAHAIDPDGNPTNSNDFDLLKLDTALGCKLSPNWGVEAGYTPSIYGQWTAAGATYTIALVYIAR